MFEKPVTRSTAPRGRGCLRAAGWWRRVVWMVCVGGVFFAPMGGAQEIGGEYQRKAIFIVKLARYVEWPKEKMEAGAPLVIGVYGTDNASEQIREVVGRQKIGGREVVVKVCATVQEVIGCHILFVSGSEEARLSSVLGKVRWEPVLTVGECDSFLKKGGIINLRSTGREVTMEINERNARRSDLRLSPQLLNLGEPPAGG